MRLERVVFGALLGLHVLAIWAVPYFPSQDGPVHLEVASAFLRYDQPEYTVLREYYVRNLALFPNWTVYLLLMGLMLVTPPLIALKLFLTGYTLALPLSARYACRAMRAPPSCAVLALPLVHGYFFYLGFYNFCVGIVLFTVLIGYWALHRGRLTRRGWLGVAGLLAALYVTHLFALGAACLTLAAIAGWELVRDAVRLRRHRPAIRRLLWTQALPLLAVTGAAGLAMAIFLSRNPLTVTVQPVSAAVRVKELLAMRFLVAFGGSEQAVAAGFGALLVGYLALAVVRRVRRRRLERWDGLLIAAAGCLVVYGLIPNTVANVGFIAERALPFVFVLAVLWLAVQPRPAAARRGLWRLGAAFAVAFLAVRAAQHGPLSACVEEYLNGARLIDANATLVPLRLDWMARRADGRGVETRFEPLLHAAGYLAATRHLVEFDNYAAALPNFPIWFRDAIDPFRTLGMIEGHPPDVDLDRYVAQTGGRIDYVLIWGLDEGAPPHPAIQRVLAQLAQGYDLILVSPQRGRMRLYRRRMPERRRATPL